MPTRGYVFTSLLLACSCVWSLANAGATDDQLSVAGLDRNSRVLSVLAGRAFAAPAIVGVVEGRDTASGTIRVSGQTVAVNGNAQALNRFADGAYIRVDGQVTEVGIIATKITNLSSAYVPGASLLFVSGFVATVDVSTAQVKVGDATVDLAPTLYKEQRIPGTGEFIQLIATQPNPNGTMVANDFLSSATINAIIGGDRQNAIIGGDRQDAIIGGDRQ
jgi:hypothetical protein